MSVSLPAVHSRLRGRSERDLVSTNDGGERLRNDVTLEAGDGILGVPTGGFDVENVDMNWQPARLQRGAVASDPVSKQVAAQPVRRSRLLHDLRLVNDMEVIVQEQRAVRRIPFVQDLGRTLLA